MNLLKITNIEFGGRKDIYVMTEIKGKINTAICYAKTIEEDAIEQIRAMCDQEFTSEAGFGLCRMSILEKDAQSEPL